MKLSKRQREALAAVGEGTSLNDFCEALGSDATVLLDFLRVQGLVEVVLSTKHKITVVLPKEQS